MNSTLSQALEHSEKLGQAFDPGVPYWRDFYGGNAVGAERLTAFREALTSIGARGLWLDAGCGVGVMARDIRESGLRVCGIDMAEQLLQEAQQVTGLRLVAAGEPPPPEEHLYRAPVERLPYDDGHFDGVYSSSVLEYVDSLELALTELHRVVRRGGYLVFTLPNAFSISRIRHAIFGRRDDYFRLVPRWAYWRWEIAALLKRSGWEPQRSSYFGATRRLRGAITKQPWAAFYVIVVARKP